MSILKKFKKFFSDDTGITKEEAEIASGNICEWCDSKIEDYDKHRKFSGKNFHVKCCRKMIKQVKKEMGA